jgi:hypothetical protein
LRSGVFTTRLTFTEFIADWGLMEALALLGSGGAILAWDNVPDRGRVIEAGGSTDGPVPKMPSDSCPKEFPVEKGEGCYGASR